MIDLTMHARTSILALGDGPVADVLLPDSDRTALIQVVVVALFTIGLAYLARRERSLVLLVVGVGAVTLGLMSLRTVH